MERRSRPGRAGAVGSAALINSQVRVAIGGRDAQVTYQGLAPGFAGLAQLNVIVPAGTASGDQAVFVTIDGLPAIPG